MKLRDLYRGENDPFEGDRTLRLRGLPAGAHVTRATVTVEPKCRPQFSETFVFRDPDRAGELRAEDWGVMKTPPGSFIEVDFHARRTLAAVDGDVEDASLEVDIGGTFVGINARGAIGPDGAFTVKPDKRLPGLTVNKLKLTRSNGTVDVSQVTVRSVPTNVSVGLGELPPFWTRVGELATTQTSPNFADVLNAFLADAPLENGFYVIPFVVHSDTIARLDVEVHIDYVLEQRVLPAQLPEVTLPYNFSTLPDVDEALTTVTVPRRAMPVTDRTTAQIVGEFQPTRIAQELIQQPTSIAQGLIGQEPETLAMAVSPERSLAQPFKTDKEVSVTGVDLPLTNEEPAVATLYLTIEEDADGKPSGAVQTKVEVRVETSLPGQSSWISATLPGPFLVERNKRYWLVLQSGVGTAAWRAKSGPAGEPGLQFTRDDRLSWRSASVLGAPTPLTALFRLRHTPERFSVPVRLQIGKGEDTVERRLDEFAPLGRVDFSFDFAEKLGEYMAGPAVASPCGSENVLIDSPTKLQARTGEPAELSQRVSVGAGCAYLLRVRFYVELPPESDSPVPPRWQIQWLNAEGESLGTDGGRLAFEGQIDSLEPQPRLYEARVVAPPEAVEAEVRFIQPPSEVQQLILDAASFDPTLEAVDNGFFLLRKTENANKVPREWDRLGGKISISSEGVKLEGDGSEDAVLAQTPEVIAGERYALKVVARPETPSSGDAERQRIEQRARVELQWQAGDEEVGDSVVLFLDGPEFVTHTWAGAAPADVTRAEIRLIQPRGPGNLLVGSVSLSRADLISIPLAFIAEAPGALTLSNMSVVYDLPEPPLLPALRLPGVDERARLRSPFAGRPIEIVAGVGAQFLASLTGLSPPVSTIAELATLDPEVDITDLPRERRLELKTRAEMILALALEAAPLATYADKTLESLLDFAPVELAERVCRPPTWAAQFQRDLRALRLLIKNDDFRSLRVADLLHGDL